jgi:L-aspartate oxidase
MTSLFDTRRYLTDFDARRTGHVVTDVLVIGSGVAGSRAAIEAARHAQVTLLCKREFGESATRYAQGGIAVALGSDDSAERHYEDTIRVGCGLNRPEAVRTLVDQSRGRIEELVTWGIDLDQTNGDFDLGREGGHSVNRVVHAHGDQTGRELVRVLKQRVGATDNLRVFEQCFLLDFLTVDGMCVGAVTHHEKYGHQLIWAKQTVLASGGCGQVWRETTNPAVTTGDGIAAAYRAGARLSDMELMQFHPTTLYVAGAGRALISEAVRGAGAHLIDRSGRRFMSDHHPDGELAPRDVVSRAIHEHLRKTRSNCVYLDVRHVSNFGERFPHITRLCRDFEIDPLRDPIPVRPSAHYLIGGVEVSLDGRSSVPGLLCCGEASCSGVHGANRMASNSLLEGLVFGALAGESAGRAAVEHAHASPLHRLRNTNPPSDRTELDLPDIRNSLRSVMWRNVGIVREAEHLQETCDILDFWGHYTMDKTFDDVSGWELQNQLTVARLVASGALARTESIGVHYRADATAVSTTRPYHVQLTRNAAGTTPIRVAL